MWSQVSIHLSGKRAWIWAALFPRLKIGLEEWFLMKPKLHSTIKGTVERYSQHIKCEYIVSVAAFSQLQIDQSRKESAVKHNHLLRSFPDERPSLTQQILFIVMIIISHHRVMMTDKRAASLDSLRLRPGVFTSMCSAWRYLRDLSRSWKQSVRRRGGECPSSGLALYRQLQATLS